MNRNKNGRMKVAYMLGSLGRGGTETLMLDVFRNSSMAEYDFMGVHRKDGMYRDAFYGTELEFVKISPRFPFDPLYLLRLRRLFADHCVSIVHAQQFLDCVYALLATLFTSVRVVETFHGYDFGYSLFDRIMVRFGIKHADALCFVSESQQKYYVERYNISDRTKCHVIYNGIDFSKLDAVTDDPVLPKSSCKDALRLAMVGNFVQVRNQYFVCRFLADLRKKGVSFDFYFVGKRSESEPWRYDDCVRYCDENGLSECVHFLGSRNDVPAILHQIDAFVYNSDHDTFGIAVAEAIACGLPTFVNDWDVMSEITQGGQLAILYRSGDVNDLVGKFMQFVENVSAYRKIASENADAIRKLYGIEAYEKRLKAVYDGLN